MPIRRGDDDRDAAEIDGDHRLLPLAGEGDEERKSAGESGEARTAEPPAGEGERDGDQRPGLATRKRLTGIRTLSEQRGLDRLEGVEEVDVDPLDGSPQNGAGRDLQRSG